MRELYCSFCVKSNYIIEFMKMKYLFSIVFVLFFLFRVPASRVQINPVLDSLERVITESKDPYELIETYSQLCWIERSRNPDQSIIYGNKALKLINTNPEFNSFKPKTLNFLGVAHRNKGDYGNALDYYFEALTEAEKQGNNIQIAYSNNNLGGIFTLKGDYNNAIDYIKKAFQYFKVENDKAGMGYCCVNIGNLYRHTGDLNEGINYFDQAIHYKEEVNDTIGIAISKNLKAIALYDNGRYEQARSLYIELQDLYKKNMDLKGLSTIKNYLGLIETSKGNYSKAINYFNEAISICEKINHLSGISFNNIGLSAAYLKSGQIKKAKITLDKGAKIAHEIGNLELMLSSYQKYTDFYVSQNNYKAAYDYQIKYQETFKLHLDELTREKIASLKLNMELDKKKSNNKYLKSKTKLLEDNVTLAESKVRFQRYFVILAFIIIVIILIPLYILIKKNKNKVSHNEELIAKNKELQEANNTRERFLSIIGHDLKNPFNSVLGLTSLVIDEWDSLPDSERLFILNEVQASSNSIYELMDNLLLWAKNQSGTIKKFPERFNINDNIIQVYEIFRNQASFKKIRIDLNIGTNNYIFADVEMVNTILRNLLSNAVKFTRKEGRIQIELKKLPNEIEFSITDNGQGIPPDDLKRILDSRDGFTTKGTSEESGTGLGLLVVQDFVNRNNGVFWIESKIGAGSRFCFTLPARL